MSPGIDEKQISIKLNDNLIGRLDRLANNGEMNRNHLMLSFVNLWLSVLEKSSMPGLFYINNLLRVRKFQMLGVLSVHEHGYADSSIPEKPYPIKISESVIFNINRFTSFNPISRHQLLKIMIIVGIEELECITENKPYEFGHIEKKLNDSFSFTMKKGFDAFQEFNKNK